MMTKQEVETALAADGLSLADYQETVLVFVDGELLADSETLESARGLVSRAREYGEIADLFQWGG